MFSFQELWYVVKSWFLMYWIPSTMFIKVPNTNLVRLPVWHKNRLLSLYLPITNEFDHASIKQIEIDGKPLDYSPVPGLGIVYKPEDFGVSKISVYDPLYDEINVHEKEQTFIL